MRIASLALYAALTVGLASGLTACSEDDPDAGDQAPAGATATDTTSESPSEDPTAEPGGSGGSGSESPSDEPDGTTGGAVPVYYVGDTPQGPRLFREFQQVSGDPLLEAAKLVYGGVPRDPDYRTEWPDVGIESVQATDGVLLVTIPGDGFTDRPDGMSKASARLAVQQLVHTLQGVQLERVPVQVQRTGTDPVLFGIDTSAPFTNAPPLDVLSLVNVTSPEQGATVDGDTLEASGVASSFEATVPWEIAQGGKVVLDGFATAEGWMDKLYPWETTIDVSGLEPGDYTFVARTDDPSGGAEGAGPSEDTKDFTLR
jgi:hypothetical protein